MNGKVESVNLSKDKGTKKSPVFEASLIKDHGFDGDAHASSQWHRQVSLLALESIEKMRAKGLKVGPGDFAENITTSGLELTVLKIGTILKIGENIEVEVSQIGKECHDRCEIYHQAGDCVMPREGIFVTVIEGGKIRKGMDISVLK
ncbi:MAG: MOSC domain-containing protein [Nitrospirota bacterium]|nr:MAG: MOSC domain-containing protein [Nitrospirota bacterium]